MNPEELRYTESHEWVHVEGDIGTIGITDHAQKQLGEIVYLELPEVGHVFNADEEFGTVESVKAVSELYVPASGEVVEVNKAAVAEPGIINDDPFGDGWLIKHQAVDRRGRGEADDGRRLRPVRQRGRARVRR